MGDDKLKVIAAELITQVRKSVTIDWTLRESARARIRVMVKRILNRYGVSVLNSTPYPWARGLLGSGHVFCKITPETGT